MSAQNLTDRPSARHAEAVMPVAAASARRAASQLPDQESELPLSVSPPLSVASPP